MENFETSYTDQPVCPYCGHAHSDAWGMEEGNSCCDACDKEFFLTEHVTIKYKTSRLEDER